MLCKTISYIEKDQFPFFNRKGTDCFKNKKQGKQFSFTFHRRSTSSKNRKASSILGHGRRILPKGCGLILGGMKDLMLTLSINFDTNSFQKLLFYFF